MNPFFYFPFFLLIVFLFFLLILIIFGLVKIGLIVIAFHKLGLTGFQTFLLLIATLIGSGINLPLYKRDIYVPSVKFEEDVFSVFFRHLKPYSEPTLSKQIIALNVGGGLIPLLLSFYFLSQIGISLELGLCFLGVSLACYKLARPIPGVGIGIPFLLPPLLTVLFTWMFAPSEIAPQVAYISGTLGTLVGADILHLLNPKEQDKLISPILSIGGAGTFDGIFLCGIIAVLLA